VMTSDLMCMYNYYNIEGNVAHSCKIGL